MATHGLSVLHVEDDIADALIIKDSLNRSQSANEQFAITHVESIKGALKELYCNDFNVVLLDMNLPDVSGVDNVKCIREENKTVPIIVMTSVDNDQWARDVLAAGAQEYVVKGHSNGDILRRIISSSIMRKDIENRLYEQIHYDQLTGLPNKMFFKGMMDNVLMKARRHKRNEALLFVDIQDFKHINMTCGEEFGDVLLKGVAQRLQLVLRECDLLVRLRGDHFAVLLDAGQDESPKSNCMIVAQKLQKAIVAPFNIQGTDVHIRANISAAITPETGNTLDEIMENVEVAMHFLKVNKDTSFCFAKNLHERYQVKIMPESAEKAG